MEAIVRSIPVYYEEYGTGIPLLILHGAPGAHRILIPSLEPIFQNRLGWRRIYPDLPGMGKTQGAEWLTNQDQMLEVVEEFIQTIAPKERFVVVGNSYGGYLARGLVYRQGISMDGVCLIVPFVEPDPIKQNYPLHQVLIEDPQFLAALTPQESNLPKVLVAQSLEILERARANVLPGSTVADQKFINKLREHFVFSFPVDQLATPFPAPSLLLTGRQDSICGYREAWSILDNYLRGTFVVLDRTGHLLDIEQRALSQALVGEWLNRVEEYVGQTTTKVTG